MWGTKNKTIYIKQLKDLALKLNNPHLTLQVGLIAQLVSRASFTASDYVV